jgi:hypothetical protein
MRLCSAARHYRRHGFEAGALVQDFAAILDAATGGLGFASAHSARGKESVLKGQWHHQMTQLSALIKLTGKVTRKLAANLTHHFVTLVASFGATFMVRQDCRRRNASKALLPHP